MAKGSRARKYASTFPMWFRARLYSQAQVCITHTRIIVRKITMFLATIVGGSFTYGIAKWILRRVTNRSTPCHRDVSPADSTHSLLHTVIFIVANGNKNNASVYTASAACDISPSINPFCMMMHEAHSANIGKRTLIWVWTRRTLPI